MRGVVGVVGLLLTAWPAVAAAGGFEVGSQGTIPLGRGGAVAARADDPMVLQYSPASLADLAEPQAHLGVHAVLYDACVTRSGVFAERPTDNVSVFGPLSTTADGGYADEGFPEVCREGGVGLIPVALGAVPLGEGVGLGFGLLTPSGAGSSRWGDADGAVRNEAGELRPVPTRYMLFESDSKRLDWSVGVGLRPHELVAFGLTAHWSMAFSESAAYVAFGSDEDPAFDILSEFQVADWFIPGFTASVKLDPAPWLQAVVGLRWLDDVRASGESDLTFGPYSTGEMRAGHTGRAENHVDEFTITTPQQTKLWASVRYAHLRRGATLPGRASRDPMRDEVFDVELTVGWEFNSRVDAFRIDVPDDTAIDVVVYDDMGGELPIRDAPVDDRVLPKRWTDQLTLHLGGDVHAIPERLTLRAGVSYESRGIEKENLAVDFMPLARLGAHAGATVRLGDLDLSAAYAHIFQETVTVGDTEAEYHAVSANADVGPVVNAGTYEASYDFFSLAATYRFR